MVVVRTITILSNHSVVVELRIIKTLVEPDIEMIKANATLTDGSYYTYPRSWGMTGETILITGKEMAE